MSLSGITTPNAQYPTPPQLGAGHAMVLTLKSTFKVFMLFLAYFTCNIFFESFFQSHNLFAMHSADFFYLFWGIKSNLDITLYSHLSTVLSLKVFVRSLKDPDPLPCIFVTSLPQNLLPYYNLLIKFQIFVGILFVPDILPMTTKYLPQCCFAKHLDTW